MNGIARSVGREYLVLAEQRGTVKCVYQSPITAVYRVWYYPVMCFGLLRNAGGSSVVVVCRLLQCSISKSDFRVVGWCGVVSNLITAWYRGVCFIDGILF
jgi:hypothetical protein